ncbi:MAG TPA: APC family permease [Acidimicrobiales bacterium]|nr:APC family permease [Acidimicrobiales bacterium]
MTATAGTTQTGARRGRTLRREIGLVGLTWASVGSIIGSGWLFGAWKGMHAAGPAAIIAWAIGGVAVLVLGLVHGELGGMYPVSGGTARFPHYAFGGAAGASFGWFSWLQAATVAPIEVLAAIGYAQHWSFARHWMNAGGEVEGWGIAVAVIFMAVLVAINFLGVRMLSHTNSTLTWWKVGVPLLTLFVVGISGFHGHNFTALGGFNPYGAKGILSAVSTSGIVFAYLGFEQADQLAGEARDPQRNIPRAVIGSVVIGVIIYMALQVVFIGALPHSALHGTWSSVTKGFTGPWAQLASLVSIGWLATVLYVDAVISPAGTGLIYATATSRVSYGLSRNGYFPTLFESVDDRGVPWFGLIVAFVVGSVCFLPFPSWSSLVGIITSASVLMYAGAPLALGAFRKRLPHAQRPYRMAGAGVLSPVAFILSSFIIMWSGWTTDWKLGVAILIGYALIALNVAGNLNEIKPTWDVRAASWLPVYLVGVGVMTYGSAWGNLKHPWFGSNDVWWDLAILGVFSLIIYFWAVAVSLPAEQMQAEIDKVVIPEEALQPVTV